MAKRRTKKRTQVQGKNDSAKPKNGASATSQTPKSMVIRIGAGEVGSSVSQLVKDFRLMMEPDTAIRLRERRANKLKDYTAMAGPLGVTHLIMFSRSSTGNTNMRLALTPRGPTLHFKVENYSLCKDVAKALKHPRGGGQTHRTPPLLVMNNFNTPDADENSRIPKRLESLSTTIFQSLFPPINPQATPLTSIRRVMMLNREKSSSGASSDEDGYVINLRHYAIATRKTGVSKRIRRLDPTEQRNTDRKKGLPNLGKLEDVADYLLDPTGGGYTSASETELDTDAEVEITENTTRKVLNRREMQRMKSGEKTAEKQAASKPNVEKRAVKLVELGPRMKLRLMKVEEGLCGGRVMWHDFISKSEKDIKKMDDEWNRRKREKEERKKQQKANIEKKKEEKAKAKANGQAVDNEDDEDVSMDGDDYDDEWESDDSDQDAEVEGEEDESMEE
ncbi:Ribosome biogenesis protein SSF2 [Talaromyces islandicus]|uniref:Ribosome biogenesis protein SSF2 n=1 Tax=Talaromyces islandicus TaxID=28573 RepID=A0A0U1MA97_TALIS|nr:Ribosome biogenesis protein SSF2 [Talaromyces islandicus]